MKYWHCTFENAHRKTYGVSNHPVTGFSYTKQLVSSKFLLRTSSLRWGNHQLNSGEWAGGKGRRIISSSAPDCQALFCAHRQRGELCSKSALIFFCIQGIALEAITLFKYAQTFRHLRNLASALAHTCDAKRFFPLVTSLNSHFLRTLLFIIIDSSSPHHLYPHKLTSARGKSEASRLSEGVKPGVRSGYPCRSGGY